MIISFGYARISTKTQHIDRQIEAIKKFRPNILEKNIFTDIESGKNYLRDGYECLKKAIEVCEKRKKKKKLGIDFFIEIIVTEIDRLGRDIKLLKEDLQKWYEKGIIVRVLNIPTSLEDISNKNIRDMLLVNKAILEYHCSFVERELELNKERQQLGIKYKKEKGNWGDYGRPRRMSDEEFEVLYQEVLEGKLRPFEFIKKYNISSPTYYRYVKRYNAS